MSNIIMKKGHYFFYTHEERSLWPFFKIWQQQQASCSILLCKINIKTVVDIVVVHAWTIYHTKSWYTSKKKNIWNTLWQTNTHLHAPHHRNPPLAPPQLRHQVYFHILSLILWNSMGDWIFGEAASQQEHEQQQLLLQLEPEPMKETKHIYDLKCS